MLEGICAQINLQIQHNPYQNPSKYFCKNWQANPNIYVENQKTQNRQNNF